MLLSPRSSFRAPSPFTALVPVNPTWKSILHAPSNIKCSTGTLVRLVYRLASSSRRRTDQVWSVVSMPPAFPLSVSVTSAVSAAEVEERQMFIRALQKTLHRGAGTTTTTIPGGPVGLGQRTPSTWWPIGGRGHRKDHCCVCVKITTASRHQRAPGKGSEWEEELVDINLNPSGSVPGPRLI